MTLHEEMLINELKQKIDTQTSKKETRASVVGRSVVGGFLAGPVGAVIGALSAIDQNNRKK